MNSNYGKRRGSLIANFGAGLIEISTFVSCSSTLSRTRSDSKREERNCRNSFAIDAGMVNIDKDRCTRRRSASKSPISSTLAAIACSNSAFQRYTTLARVFKSSVVSNCVLSAAAYVCSTHCFALLAVTLKN